MLGGAFWLAVPKGEVQGFGESWLWPAGRIVQAFVAVLVWGVAGIAFVAAAYGFWGCPWLASAIWVGSRQRWSPCCCGRARSRSAPT